MTRLVLNLRAAMSLALCLALVVLWVATRETEAHLSVSVPRLGRYTLYSQYGEVRMFGVAGASLSNRLTPAARRISNGDVYWDVYYSGRRREDQPLTILAGVDPGTTSGVVERLGVGARAEMIHALLDALDDPDRFAAAHAVLCDSLLNPKGSRVPPEQVGQTVRGDSNGLPVELDLAHAEKVPTGRISYILRHRGDAVRLDPATRFTVRDWWYATLSVPLASVPYWQLAAAAAMLPAVRAARALKRRRDARRGLCRRCGYDLRATPDRCPECGQAR